MVERVGGRPCAMDVCEMCSGMDSGSEQRESYAESCEELVLLSYIFHPFLSGERWRDTER